MGGQRSLQAVAAIARRVSSSPFEGGPMNNYEITFEWPNGDWTWIYLEAKDFHEAICRALCECPRECRVHNVHFVTVDQLTANRAAAARRNSIGARYG